MPEEEKGNQDGSHWGKMSQLFPLPWGFVFLTGKNDIDTRHL
jgi:hypothetical protein